MKYKKENGEKSTVKFTVSLSSEEWEAAIEKAYQKTKNRYSMPGFRKGKVPRKMLEKTYGAGLFFEDAINEAIPGYYSEILDKEKDIVVLDRPEIDVKSIDEKGVKLILTAPVKPEVKIGAYKGIKIEKVEYNVSDDELKERIERELNMIKERNSRIEEAEGRAAEDGDIANIDYSGSVDGVKFDGGTAAGYDLILGSKTFIPGFEEQVVGMKCGEEKDITVKFPEEYHAKELAGKDAVFAVKLNTLKKKILPEITDELIKDGSEYSDLESLKAGVGEKLKEEKIKSAKIEEENKIIKAITDATEVVIPDVLIEKQIDNMVQDTEYRLMYQGLRLNDYLKYSGTTMEAFRDSFKAQAEESVKSQLVVDYILDAEKIKAEEGEIEAKLKEGAEKAGKELEEYKKGVSDYQKEYIEREIIVSKLFDFLRANNEIA